jgi:LemA protein
MDASIGLWLFVAATIFWMVGLYNRLMRLRARAQEVLTALERQIHACVVLLVEYGAALPTHGETSSQVHDPLPEPWAAVAQAAQVLQAIWEAPRKKRLSISAQQKRAYSWYALQTAWEALLATPPDLAGAPVPEALRTQWEGLRQKALSIQDALNLIIQNYNEALQEHPARWVAGLMGFEPSAPIEDTDDR